MLTLVLERVERISRRPLPTTVVSAGRREPPVHPLRLVAVAAWCGLVTGLLELGLLVARKHLYTTAALGSLQINRHFPWMIPAANTIVFGACGLAIALAARLGMRCAPRVATVWFSFLVALTLLLGLQRLHMGACVVLAVGITCRAAPRLWRRPAGLGRLVGFSFPVLAGVVVVLMGLTLDRERFSERRAVARLAKPRRNTPNVLLIVLDTVRADHLSLHGYNRATSPNLERLAQGGVRFDSARATAPWTLPAHASMFTGRWSHELFSGAQQPMTATYPTLAEFLHDRGYETAGFVANTYYCNSWFGLDRGFIHYEDHFDGDTVVSPAAILRCSELGKRLLGVVGWAMDNPLVRKDAARINRELLEWLAHRRHDRPFFAFLNYIDAHDPYVVPAGFDRHFGVKPESPADLAALLNFHQADKTKWSARDAALIHDAYDDCLAALDGRLGRLFNLLRDLKVLDNTLVVVTADHGESLGEHRLYGHAMSLYQPELHVPLIIVGPSGVPKGRVVRETVSLRDLPATVVDRLGFASESPFPGHTLASFWDPAGTRKRPAVDPVLSETSIGAKPTDPKSHVPALRGPMRSLAAGRNVYIRSGKGEEELYDLESDPHETRNLASSPEARSVLEQFRAGLAPFLRDEGPPR